MAADVLQEFVVKLTTQIDNPGMQQIIKFLDSNKIKALGVASALTAATTAVYKFVESYTKEELSLRNLAKQKKKNLEQLRAEEAALKQMGVTLNDIKKDKALKSMYDDLVKFNKEMSLPNMDRAMEKVNGLRLAFYKFRSAVSYVVKAIGAQVLTNLEAPINRITGKLNNAANWIRDNLNQIAAKVGSVITAFAKGIIGIAETFEKIGKWVADLPAGIKAAGAAIIGVIGLLNSGPIGQILAAITIIGDIIHDYENFQWNKQNMEVPIVFQTPDGGHTSDIKKALIGEDGKPVAYQLPIAFTPIWEAVDEGKETGDIFTVIGKKLTESLNGAFKDFDMDSIFGGGESGNSGLISKITEWFKKPQNEAMLQDLGESIINFVSGAIRVFGGTAGGALAKIIEAIFGDGTVSEDLYKDDGSAAAAFMGGIGGFVAGVVDEIKNNPKSSLLDKFKGGLKGLTIGSLLTSLLSNIEGGEIKWDEIGTDLSTVGMSFLGVIKTAVGKIGDIGSVVFDLLADGIRTASELPASASIKDLGDSLAGVLEGWASDSTISTSLSASIATALAGGSFLESIAAGAVGAFSAASDESMREALRRAMDDRKYRKTLIEINNLNGEELRKEYESLGDEYKSDYWEKLFGNLGGAGEEIITGLFKALFSGLKTASDVGSDLVKLLVQTILDIIVPENGGVAAGLEDNSFAGMLGVSIGTKMLGGNFFTSLLTGVSSALAEMESKRGENESLWDVIVREAEGFWDKILDIWYGPIEQLSVDGNGQGVYGRNENKGLSLVFKNILWGAVDEFDIAYDDVTKEYYRSRKGGILNWLLGYDAEKTDANGNVIEGEVHRVKGFFENAFESVKGGMEGFFESFLAPLGSAILKVVTDAWFELEKQLPGWLKALLGINGTAIKVTDNGDGTASIENIAGEEVETSPEIAESLKEKGGTLSEDSFWLGIPTGVGGKVMLPGMEQFRHSGNGPAEQVAEYTIQTLSRLLTEAATNKDMRKFSYLSDLWEKTWAGMPEGPKSAYIGDFANYIKAFAKGDEKIPDDYVIPLKADVDMSDVDRKVDDYKGTINLGVNLVPGSGDSSGDDGNGGLSGFGGVLEHEALGGRMDHRQVVEVAEDGAEYIIPVTKTERAISLIMQMLNEMGSSAVSRIFDGLGIGQSGTIGANMASLSSAMQGMTINNNYNISAPVSINVNSNGASAEDIGTTAYNLAERHLVNTLRGAWA